MIKTVKVEKKMRLDELINYVWESGIENENYYSDLGNHVSVGVQTLLWSNSTIGKNDTFTVEVEEEITEDTTFERLVTLGCRGTINVHDDKSLSDLSGKKEYGAQVFALINGKLELIWEAE